MTDRVYPIWQRLKPPFSGPNWGQTEDHPICQVDGADFDPGDEAHDGLYGLPSDEPSAQ